MHTTLTRPTITSDVPETAPGHNGVTFCNTACAHCDDEMSHRSARVIRRHLRDLRDLMSQAPTGR